jgi:8-oxo-dGTP pyrophosphatase MutT (NUDIX family)
MRSDQAETRVFGAPDPCVACTPRHAAYAVIKDAEGRIAAVIGARRARFLPGGGAMRGETPEQTVVREVREELARGARVVREIGAAIQYFRADGRQYRMEATFFAAELTSAAAGAGEHELCWLAAEEIEGAFYHECHAWACRQL